MGNDPKMTDTSGKNESVFPNLWQSLKRQKVLLKMTGTFKHKEKKKINKTSLRISMHTKKIGNKMKTILKGQPNFI